MLRRQRDVVWVRAAVLRSGVVSGAVVRLALVLLLCSCSCAGPVPVLDAGPADRCTGGERVCLTDAGDVGRSRCELTARGVLDWSSCEVRDGGI